METMNLQNKNQKRTLTSSSMQSVINKVNSGKVDSSLRQLKGTPFGVYVNAHIANGSVDIVPPESSVTESNLDVSVTANNNKKEPGAVKVGWYASGGSICSFCDDPHDCRSHSNPSASSGKEVGHFPALADAKELKPISLDLEEYGDLLCELSKDDLGIFLCHGHNDQFAFTELPSGCVAVVENGRTGFRAREDVISKERFVPNVWRMENDEREVVGGFLVS